MTGGTLFEPRVGEEAEVEAEEVVVVMAAAGDSSVAAAAVGECGCSHCRSAVAVAAGVEWVELEVFPAEEALGTVLAGGVSGAARAEVGDGAATGVEAVRGAAGCSEPEAGVGAAGPAGAEAAVGAVEAVGTEAVVGAAGQAGTEAAVGAGVGEGASRLDNRPNADCDAGDRDAAACPPWMCQFASARKTRAPS